MTADSIPPALVGLTASADAGMRQNTQGKGKMQWGIYEAGSVNAGGDIRVFGPSAETIWVRQPGDPRKVRPLVELHDAAVATSASYFSRRPSARADEFMTAIVDPLSGRSRGPALSVSVRAADCMTADALTKVVTISEDDEHPALAHFGASALMLREAAHEPMQ